MTARDTFAFPLTAAAPGGLPPATPARLKKRADFLAAAKGRRVHTGGFTLQSAARAPAPGPGEARVGLTVTKKTGNSVERNRIRRRLREALRQPGGLSLSPANDYVIVARRELLAVNFLKLRADLASAIAKISMSRPPRGGA